MAIVLVALIVLCCGGIMLSSGEWEVTRTMEMNATRAEIHAYTADWDKWPTWSPFEKEDPNMVITIDGESTGVGASRSWISESQGNGSMVITMSDPEKGMTFDLTMEGFPSFEGEILYADGSREGTTLVTWTDRGVNEGLMGKAFAKMMEPMLGPKFEQGLKDLEDAVVNKK